MPSETPPAASESWWLIERRPPESALPEYWSGVHVGWTSDPWKAQRYATEEEATRAIRSALHPFIPSVPEARAVSHGFMLPALASDLIFECESLQVRETPSGITISVSLYDGSGGTVHVAPEQVAHLAHALDGWLAHFTRNA